MTHKELADTADRIVGAAQALEKAAKALKANAKAMRQHGLHESITVDVWLMHRSYDVRTAAERALVELGLLDTTTLHPASRVEAA